MPKQTCHQKTFRLIKENEASMTNTIYAADLFCGAGGTSTGLLHAAKRLNKNVRLLAVNHWDVAVKTHQRNHPDARHLTTGLESVTPADVVPGGKLDLLWASPSCTHHSVARGGRPRCDQSRAQPHLILDWLDQLYVRRVMMENVPAFTSWGPLGTNGHPLKSRAGVLFDDYVRSLQARGYKVDWRILCCADYGDPTTRERFFLQAVRGREKIRWPEPTHAKNPGGLFGDVKPWRPARDIIDWSIPGTSIFRRKKLLAPNTLRRIEAGIERFWGKWAEPFLVILRGTRDGQLKRTAISLENPLPTLTAGAEHVGLVQPYVISVNNGSNSENGNCCVRSIDEPIGTQTGSNTFGVIQPFIIPQLSCGANRGMDEPVPTITTTGAHALCSPFLTTVAHGTPDGNFDRRVHSIDDPFRTLTGTGEQALVQPFISAIGQTGGGDRVRSVDDPLPAVVTKQEQCLVEPFIISYYGKSLFQSIHEPFATITTRDRFGVVMQYGLEILFRMLQPHELALAHSFPRDYFFAGNKGDVVKQIGNSVPAGTSEALCYAALADSA